MVQRVDESLIREGLQCPESCGRLLMDGLPGCVVVETPNEMERKAVRKVNFPSAFALRLWKPLT